MTNWGLLVFRVEAFDVGGCVEGRTGPVARGAVPVDQYTNGECKQEVGYDQRQDEMPEVVVPRIPGHHHVWICPAVVAGKRDSNF